MNASHIIIIVAVNILNDIIDTRYTYQLTSIQQLEFRSTICLLSPLVLMLIYDENSTSDRKQRSRSNAKLCYQISNERTIEDHRFE